MNSLSFKPTNVRLSDTQLIMMSAAAQREDRCLIMADKLKGGATRKVADKLIAAGLVKEIRAKPGMAWWRRDEAAGQYFALKLTAAGLKAIAIEEDGAEDVGASGRADATTQVDPADSGAPVTARETFDLRACTETPSPLPAPVAPRAGSKLAEVLRLLGSDKGASIDEFVAALDWLPHTTRAALTGLRKRGYAIDRRREDGSTRYRLASPEVCKAPGVRASGPCDEADGVGRADEAKQLAGAEARARRSRVKAA